jgi:hypothetical protein
MSEWWTYTLSDFLLFSSRTYNRLFEIYNAAIWPAQIVAIGLGVAILVLLLRAPDARVRTRAIAAILAACWLWVAIAFHANRYATINWAAVYFAWAFGFEAALWTWIALLGGRLSFDRPIENAGRAGLGIFLFALAIFPLATPLFGRGWKAAGIFGVAPDPTVLATLGLLLVARGRARAWLMVIPVIWCVISGLTLLAMKSPDAWILALAVALVAVLHMRRGTPVPRSLGV